MYKIIDCGIHHITLQYTTLPTLHYTTVPTLGITLLSSNRVLGSNKRNEYNNIQTSFDACNTIQRIDTFSCRDNVTHCDLLTIFIFVLSTTTLLPYCKASRTT